MQAQPPTTPGVGNPPLSDIRVLELGSFVSGPTAARILADFGAQVIKVEAPGAGDEIRSWGTMVPTRDGEVSAWFLSQSRNKQFVTIDLRQPEGQDLVRQLVGHTNILIENFRPGRMEAWGLGYEQLAAINPALVMVRISGYGQTGPYSQRAGYGNVSESMGGLRYVTGFPDRPPVRVGVSLGDALAAQQAAFGAMLALRVAERTGRGQVVDVAITESVFAVTEGMLTEYAHRGVVRERSGNALNRAAPSNVYHTGDDRWLAIGGNGDNVFRRLSGAMGQPDLPKDPRFRDNQSRVANARALDAIIQEWVEARSLDELNQTLAAAGVPAGPVYSIADIAADPQYQARGMIAHVPDERMPDGTATMPGIIPCLAATPGRIIHTGRDPGADNEHIFKGMLGLSDEAYARLQEQGVIATPTHAEESVR